MRAVAVHEDALVVTSLFWQLNAVALRAGEEAMLIDSPYFPEELELLPAVLAQAGFTPAALLATHADFDHLLGRAAFPDLSLGVAESTMLRIRAEPGAAQRELRSHDERFYVERPRPLALGSTQSLPVPGHLGLGDQDLELHATGGHTADGMAVFAPWSACWRWRSPVAGRDPDDLPRRLGHRLPLDPGGPGPGGRASVDGGAGHGAVLDREGALRVLEEDLAYLDGLEKLPPGRDSAEQRRIHEANLRAAAGVGERRLALCISA